MTRVRVEDLPPKLRKQVEEKAAGEAVPLAAETRRTGAVARDPGPRYRCHTCGVEFARYGAAAERHADEHGGARLEAIL